MVLSIVRLTRSRVPTRDPVWGLHTGHYDLLTPREWGTLALPHGASSETRFVPPTPPTPPVPAERACSECRRPLLGCWLCAKCAPQALRAAALRGTVVAARHGSGASNGMRVACMEWRASWGARCHGKGHCAHQLSWPNRSAVSHRTECTYGGSCRCM
eukprot:4911667-Prymnesium_polylepis.2